MAEATPKKGMQDYVIVYDGATEQSINVAGDFCHVQDVSVDGTAVYLRFDDGPKVTRFKGQGNRVYYSRVSVSASAACTVTLQLGNGYATDSRATFQGNVTVNEAPASTNPGIADVACGAGAQTLLIAADASRIGVYVSLPSTSVGPLRVADNTAAAAQGMQIEPGDKVLFPTTAALYAWNPNASGVTVTMTGLK